MDAETDMRVEHLAGELSEAINATIKEHMESMAPNLRDEYRYSVYYTESESLITIEYDGCVIGRVQMVDDPVLGRRGEAPPAPRS